MTAFSNVEEGPTGVGLHDKVPFQPEDRFNEQGANYECAGAWNSLVKVAEIGAANIVSGQNPQSSEECARKMLQLLSD